MTAVIILNIVFSVFVVAGIVGLLGFGIVRDRVSRSGMRARRAVAAPQRTARAPRRTGRLATDIS